MKRYALVVGIGEYNSLSALSKPVNDAKAVARVLREYGNFEQVRLLCGTKAKPGWVDYKTLENSLTEFLTQQSDRGNALIYFTGHGFTVEENKFAKRGYLATSDCQVEFENGRIISQKKGFSFEYLNWLIQQVQLSSLVMLLDCCHSGFFIEDSLVKQSLSTFCKTNYCLIAACRGFQEAYALKMKDHSIFTEALLNSLLPENANQREVSVLDSFIYIERELKGSGQEPIFMGAGGVIPLISYAALTETLPDNNICPYQGLEVFTEATAKFFFGRQAVVEFLWQKLEQIDFVPVIGASGSGKSSVVRAGLIPALKQSGNEWEIIDPIKPGFKPLQSLETALERFFPGLENQRLLDKCINDEQSQGLISLIEALPQERKFLLVVDQFEELFTISHPQQSSRFIALLSQLGNISNSRLAVVITMRADFLEPCLNNEFLNRMIQNQAVYMPLLQGTDLTNAILKPAEKQGCQLTPDLLGEILKDTRCEPGFLPLLQFALTKLWQECNSQTRELTLQPYLEMGRLAGALDRHADRIYEYRDYIDPHKGEINSFPKQARNQIEKDWIRAILLRLIRTGEEKKDIRQRQPQSVLLQLAGEKPDDRYNIKLVLESLIKGRLLISENESIDLAHEALIQGWKRLADWCQESRELRRLSQRLQSARLEWEKDQQNLNLKEAEKDRNLMMGGLLAEVREQWEVLKPYLQDLSQDEQFFWRSDRYERDRITTLQRALTEAQLREQAAKAVNLLPFQPKEALELAIQLIGQNQEKLPDQLLAPVQTALHQVMNLARVPNIIQGHKDSVVCLAFSSEGSKIVSGSDDGTVRLWDLQGNPIGLPCQGHRGSVRSVALNADTTIVISGGDDKTLRLWDLQGNPLLQPLEGHQGSVRCIAVSPDGKVIASASDDGTIRLWNFRGQLIGQPFREQEVPIKFVAFSPDSQIIISIADNNTLHLRDFQGNTVRELLLNHSGAIEAVAFSPDGQIVASGCDDGIVRLWDLQGNSIGQMFHQYGYGNSIRCVAFSPDGEIVASGSDDGAVRLWDLRGNLVEQLLQEHRGSVRSITFSPNSQSIVSSGEDNNICLWDLQGDLVNQPFQGHKDDIRAIAFSPDGKTIASSSLDGTIRLWNLQGNPIGQPFRGHWAGVGSVAFSPDGQIIASGCDEGTIHLWDLQGNSLTRSFRGRRFRIGGLEYPIKSIAFSLNGQIVISVSEENDIHLWDLQGNLVGRVIYPQAIPISSFAVSTDGQTIVIGSYEGTIFLCNLQDISAEKAFQAHSSSVMSVAFSPDGQTIATGSCDSTIRLWDLQGNPIGSPFQGHSSLVMSVAFSPDGQTIASGSCDGTIRLWDLQGNPIGSPHRHGSSVTSVVFSPDGQTIASGGTDNKVHLWRGNWQAWLKVCCTRLVDYLISKDPGINVTGDKFEFCQKYIWSNTELASILIKQGRCLLRHDRFSEAITKFKQALELDSTSDVNPEEEIRRSRAFIFIAQGRELAIKGHVDSALAAFQEALSYEPTLKLNTRSEIERLAIPTFIALGRELAIKGHFDSAIAAFQQALYYNPTLKLYSEIEHFIIPNFTEPAKELFAFLAIEEATNNFQESREYSLSLEFKSILSSKFYLETKIEQFQKLLQVLIGLNEAINLLIEGDSEVAIAKFYQARAIAPNLETTLIIEEIQQLVFSILLEKCIEFIETGMGTQARVTFSNAQKLEPSLAKFADAWNVLCECIISNKYLKFKFMGRSSVWRLDLNFMADRRDRVQSEQYPEFLHHSSLWMFAFNFKADRRNRVQAESRSSNLVLRCLAKALTDNLKGAIQDLQFITKRIDSDEAKSQLLEWIKSLESGENPFTPTVIENLFSSY